MATLGGLVINPATGRVNVTPAEAREAERLCRQRELFNMRFLKSDMKRAAGPADEAMVERVMTAARDNPAEAVRLIFTFDEVQVLFRRGALFFNPEEKHERPRARAKKQN